MADLWIDTTLKVSLEDLLWLVPGDDLPLIVRWIQAPGKLTREEAETVTQILEAIRNELSCDDEQVTYRWVDNRTGEVDP